MPIARNRGGGPNTVAVKNERELAALKKDLEILKANIKGATQEIDNEKKSIRMIENGGVDPVEEEMRRATGGVTKIHHNRGRPAATPSEKPVAQQIKDTKKLIESATVKLAEKKLELEELQKKSEQLKNPDKEKKSTKEEVVENKDVAANKGVEQKEVAAGKENKEPQEKGAAQNRAGADGRGAEQRLVEGENVQDLIKAIKAGVKGGKESSHVERLASKANDDRGGGGHGSR